MRGSLQRLSLLLLLGTFWAGAAAAAGLGRLNLLSYLGQPLHAEVELVGVTKEELATLNARIASPEAYRRANLQYNAALPGARVSIEKRADGRPYLKITSSRPLNEPFIDLLIELTWSSGRIVREYTALVDPPGAAPAGPVEPGVAAAPPPPVPAPVAPRRAEPAPGAKQYGPIERGETLATIAKRVMPEGVTLEQTLVALYRSNPDAFVRNNLNLVRAGKILKVPEKDEIAALPQAEAAKEYRAHVADWNTYRGRLAEAAPTAAAETAPLARGRIGARVEEKAAAEPKDVLRISKGEPPGAAAEKGKPRALAERVRALEEERVARDKALNEANERIAQLEKTIADMKKLLALKSPALAAAQQQAEGALRKPEVAPEKKEAPAPKPEAAAAPKAEALAPEPQAAAAPKAEAPAPKPEAAPKPKPKAVAPPPPPPPQPGLVEQIVEAVGDPLYVAAGGGVLVLGGLGLWLARRRRVREAVAEAPAAAPAEAPVAAAGAAEGAAAPAAEPAAAPTAADEVDPLAEAEIYMAYGRDGQAEEILKEALARTPDRADVKLKLLEIYAARKDKDAFGRIAQALHAQTGGKGEQWLKAAAMGYALDPANPLYAAGKDAPAVAPAGPVTGTDLDFDLGLAAPAGATTTDITLEPEAVQAATQTVVDTGALGAAAEEPAAPLVPDFTLEVPPAEAPTRTDLTLEPAAPAPGPGTIDFQIELPKVEAAADQPTVADQPALAGDLDFKIEIPDVTLDLGAESKTEAAAAGGEPRDGRWYEVQTKFDLAKAYQEMGDKAGAREILQEVLNEGDAEQKAQAQALLQQLG